MTKQDKPKNPRQGSVSRRGFLKRAGLTPAGAAMLEGGLLGGEVAAQKATFSIP